MNKIKGYNMKRLYIYDSRNDFDRHILFRFFRYST